MKNVGIICEYNPLHGGHKYMISRLREMGAERIVCLMSGNAVQRGDLAIMPKTFRATAALGAGADVVFELPFPYAMGSAEFFASAGVDILARLGVDTIAFGSEEGDIGYLRKLSLKAEEFKPSEDKSIGTASDYFASLGYLRSNDILGIEYLKAGRRFAPDMNFVTVRREGARYYEDSSDGSFPSATELRRAIVDGCLDKYSPYQLPPESKNVILDADKVGKISLMRNVGSAVIYFWRTCRASELSGFAECGGGVAERLSAAAHFAGDYNDMMLAAVTKRYTYSRLRRAALFGMTGVTLEDLKRPAAYVNLLAANGRGIEFVSGVRGIDVVSKPSKIPQNEAAGRQFELGKRLDELYTLATEIPKGSGFYLKQSPLIVKD